jgi:hypothetical protein
MSYAYTPGLKIKKTMVVQKRRILPLAGEVLVKVGDKVDYDTIVARTYIPGDVNMIPVAYILGVEPYQLPKVMLKKEGDPVKEGEMIAVSKGFFGLFKSEYKAKNSGTVELISNATGMMAIREQPIPIQRTAYIPGKIVEVEPEFGVLVETNASIIQGIFGFGGERHGDLITVAGPEEILTEDHVGRCWRYEES